MSQEVTAAVSDRSEIVEFPDAPVVGASLFVLPQWGAGLPEKLPPGDGATVLCKLLACDGERSWEGALRHSDLGGPLGESFGDASNLRLLCNALAGPQSSSEALPRSEAIWTCSATAHAPLELAIRFVYREGPVVAVRGVRLAAASLSSGLSRFFDIARQTQLARDDVVAAANDSCLTLQKDQEVMKQRLQQLPSQLEQVEERLLEQMVAVLNAQKKRCRKLWLDNCEMLKTGARGGIGRFPRPEPPMASLEECLEQRTEADGRDAVEEEEEHQENPGGYNAEPVCDSALSLVIASLPQTQVPASASAGPMGHPPTFTIPMTLGMSESLLPSMASSAARSQRRGPAQAGGQFASAARAGGYPAPVDKQTSAPEPAAVGDKRLHSQLFGEDTLEALLEPKKEPRHEPNDTALGTARAGRERELLRPKQEPTR
eukprot:TRINITY_DN82629_c0_g1_i1.p1 TRINITY_DN82629_c0_g1~~TRINITY_DN82629_c0_g1_i1.p1  ORF type:complete len:431 (+),score=68.84 TRINITY_DN82629_c0_g1_i1:37-1329(+)